MKKILLSAGVATTLLMAVFPVVYASTNSTSTGQSLVVAQGPGYTVTAAAPNAAKPSNSNMAMQPLSDTGNDIPQGGSGTFNGQYAESYSNGQLQDTSELIVNDQHNLTSSDYLSVSGNMGAIWTGSTPYDANYIYMTPQELASATATVVSVSVPASVTLSPEFDSMQLTWQEATVTNNWMGSYNWSQWEVSDAGHFTDVHTDDEATFQFGTQNYGLLNDLDVSIG